MFLFRNEAPRAITIVVLGLTVLLSAPGYGVVAALAVCLVAFEHHLTSDPDARLAVWMILAAVTPTAVAGIAPAEIAGTAALPAYVMADRILRSARVTESGSRAAGYSVTSRGQRLALGLAAVGLFGVAVGSTPLIGAALLGLAWLAGAVGRGWWLLWGCRLTPVVARQRILAGQAGAAQATVSVSGPLGLPVEVTAVPPWAKVTPREARVERTLTFATSFTHGLAGPDALAVDLVVSDPRALLRRAWSSVTLVSLIVVPRARYARWLAQAFLAGRSTANASGAARGTPDPRLREVFAGARFFQPGDVARDIDWKRTLKYREVVVRQYEGEVSQEAVLAVNLEARDAESADRLALDLISIAITLAESRAFVSLVFYQGGRGPTETFARAGPDDLVKLALAHLKDITHTGRGGPSRTIPDIRWLRGLAAGEDLGAVQSLVDFDLRSIELAGRAQGLFLGVDGLFHRVRPPGLGIILSDAQGDAEAIALVREKLALAGVPCLIARPGDIWERRGALPQFGHGEPYGHAHHHQKTRGAPGD